jgi:hypothetical protein
MTVADENAFRRTLRKASSLFLLKAEQTETVCLPLFPENVADGDRSGFCLLPFSTDGWQPAT